MRTAFSITVAALAAVALGAVPVACVYRDRTCASATECATRFGGGMSCVAGRCVEEPKDGGAPLRPAILATNVRRVVVHPTDVAWLESGADPRVLPPAVAIGKTEGKLLLHFEAPMTADDEVVEAYLLLDRIDVMDTDPTSILLHAERVVEPWSARTISWARQPRVEDVRSPSTVVSVGARPLVRLDVSDLVRHWKLRDPADQGLAVVAGGTNRTGVPFAMVDSTASADPSDPTKPVWIPSGPRLELYLSRPVNASPSLSSNATDGGPSPPPSASIGHPLR